MKISAFMYEPSGSSEIIIKFPPHLLREIKATSVMPEKYAQYQLPGAKVLYSEGTFGAFISQTISRLDWTMGMLIFDVNKPETFHPYYHSPFSGIYFSLEGDISLQLTPQQTLKMHHGHYGMSYLPAGTIGDTFVGPGLHAGLYFSFSDKLMSIFAEGHPALQELSQKHQNGSPEPTQLSRFVIPTALMHTIEQILNQDYQGAEAAIFAQKSFNDFILAYIRNLKEDNMSPINLPPTSSKIGEAARYLRNHLDNPKTIQRLARDAGMNITSFEREFKKLISVRPIEYLMLCRIEEAERILKTTNKTLDSIAGIVGFTDRSHMYKTFQKIRGRSPSSYRKGKTTSDQ